MNQRRHIAVIAACATIMGAFPLTPLFENWTWLIQTIILVALICAALVGVRALRAPVWLQPLAGLVVLFIGVTWIFGHNHAYGGIFPDLDTVRYFGTLASRAGTDLNNYAPPVPEVPSFQFITASSMAICAIVIDLLAVGLRRPALAGLPILATYVVAIEVDQHGVPFWTFVVAAVGYLWLLVSDSIDRVRMFGRRFTGDGRSMDLWEPSPLASTGRRIAVVGVAIALVIPLILPNVGSGLVHRASSHGTGNGTGTCTSICSGGVNMFAALKGQLNTTDTVNELTVSTDEQTPGENLRLGVADKLTKTGFSATANTGSPLNATQNNIREPSQTRHTARVTIDQFSMGLLPMYLDPDTASFQGLGGWGFDPASETGFSSGSTTKGMTYEFAYYEPKPTAQELRAAGPIPVTSPLMNEATVPQDLPLVDQIVSSETVTTTNEFDTVRALESYLTPENGFAYSLSTKVGTSGSDIVDFLTNKQGFCVQYAATLAWLVRAAHYPARVAFGFLGGTKQSDGTTYLMTNHDLHAWTEVYFPNYGWVPFDPTPGVSNKIIAGYDKSSTTPEPSVTGPSSSATAAAPHPVRPTESAGAVAPSSTKARHSGGPGWTMWVLLALLVVLALAACPAIARTMLRRRRSALNRTGGGGEDAGQPWVVADELIARDAALRRAHAAWDEFMDILVDFEVSVDLTESPAATSERIIRTTDLTDGGRSSVRAIGRAEQHARYARVPGTIGALERDLRRFRRELADNVPFTMRIRAVILPPSVIARWREAVASAWATTAGSLSAAGERVARALRLPTLLATPRRLLAGRAAK